jgi:ribosomal protein S18 acetylase RimI-like enzyme
MTDSQSPDNGRATRIEEIESFSGDDLPQLCDLAHDAIIDGEGFLWVRPPPQRILENYWNGVVLVPERSLWIARLDGRIVGTVQILNPSVNNESGAFAAQITTLIVAGHARRLGLARGLLRQAEAMAISRGFTALDLDVRADREAAIRLFEAEGYKRWGVKPRYARIQGRYISGYYFSKFLDTDGTP